MEGNVHCLVKLLVNEAFFAVNVTGTTSTATSLARLQLFWHDFNFLARLQLFWHDFSITSTTSLFRLKRLKGLSKRNWKAQQSFWGREACER